VRTLDEGCGSGPDYARRWAAVLRKVVRLKLYARVAALANRPTVPTGHALTISRQDDRGDDVSQMKCDRRGKFLFVRVSMGLARRASRQSRGPTGARARETRHSRRPHHVFPGSSGTWACTMSARSTHPAHGRRRCFDDLAEDRLSWNAMPKYTSG
jgi:hypothetical protein